MGVKWVVYGAEDKEGHSSRTFQAQGMNKYSHGVMQDFSQGLVKGFREMSEGQALSDKKVSDDSKPYTQMIMFYSHDSTFWN